MPDSTPVKSLSQVLLEEQAQLSERRKRHFGQDFADRLEFNSFGIALSGGGIRSAVINLGFLRTLNRFKLLKQADYLSSVSGGGYTNAYIQAFLQGSGDYEDLFQEKHIDYLRQRGIYMFPGKGLTKIWNVLTLIIAFLVSLVMSLVSPGVVIGAGYLLYKVLEQLIEFRPVEGGLGLPQVYTYGAIIFGIVLGVHYLLNVLFLFRLSISAWFNRLETGLIFVGLAALAWTILRGFAGMSDLEWQQIFPYLGLAVCVLILGFFTNPNATSFHRFYRKQLADAFLYFAGPDRNLPLRELQQVREETELAPYPLFNTTLNLLASKDPNFQGSKASDYFLLSPLYCGAKLTGYVPTATTRGYRDMTVPAATTISAAAVNPGMGAYSNRILSILTTVLNLRLGFWVWNPKKMFRKLPLVWWPSYFFYEMFGQIGLENLKVNISDGGHIENLGVMELLRRECKLIVAVDAEADPDYGFGALENLTVRARNELGIDIRFREDHIPEKVIRPHPSHGYSKQRFAIADMYLLWEKIEVDGEEQVVYYEDKSVGTFVYVKSSVTAPKGKPLLTPADGLRYGTYKYKLYHPAFPHESTADQFFDPIQWESYYQLGQFLAADMLACEDLTKLDENNTPMLGLDELQEYFETGRPLFYPQPLETEATSAAAATVPDTNYEM
ncbi:MAG: hypothetical protein AAF433_07120 [Bacteroidota bacterium]